MNAAARRTRGSASMAALALLVLLASTAAGGAMVLRASSSYAGRSAAREEEDRAMAAAAEKVLRALCADPSPDRDSPLDPVWDAVREAAADGTAVDLSDAGAGFNPNWIQKNLLEKTGLGDLLRPGRTADELQQRREERGPAADILAGYGDMFVEKALESHGSGWGYANVNVTDEFVLRRLYALRTGDEAGAEGFHARVQRLLADRKLAATGDLAEILGPGMDALFPLVNAEPVFNVHYLDPLVLKELLAYPEWKVTEPAGTAARILDARGSSEIGPEDLKRLVTAPEDSRVWQYLGTVTWFWRVRVARGGRELVTVAARIPGDGPPVFQVVEERRIP